MRPSPARGGRSPVVGALLLVVLVSGAVPAAAGGGGPSGRGPGGPAAPGGSVRSKALPALTDVAAPDALSRALRAGRISAARYALERATSLFHVRDVRARLGAVAAPDPRSATLILRDLALRLRELRGRELSRARAILARPTDGFPTDPDAYTVPEAPKVCSTNICVHYVPSTTDMPDLTDVSPANGIPDWVETTLAVMDEVWAFEVVGYGYRAPKSDMSSSTNGGNAKLDVYLSNIGPDGLFGYCATDDPHLFDPSYIYFDLSAYCVLDNDYLEYPYSDPMDPLKVTAAHEFFHAVQFAYDAAEDRWLLEGTATWMEDEVYDAVNDNLGYLAKSPLAQPGIPLDRGVGLRVYGNWIFWRFLSEYIGANDGGPSTDPDPTIVRDIWERADGSVGGPDKYSLRATSLSIAARTFDGTPWRFRWAFADFAVWNSRPKKFYDEGGSYPAAAVAKSVTIRRSKPSTVQSAVLDHLANRLVVLRRGSGVGPNRKLRVSLSGPAYNNGTEASIVVIRKSGAVSFKAIPITVPSGDGVVTVGFGSTISRVIVIVTNASTRFTQCFSAGTPYSCAGRPTDENRTFTFDASLR